MKCYFHCDANMYKKRVRVFLEYVVIPVVIIVVFLTVCLLLSLRNLMHGGLLIPAVEVIVLVVFVAALAARVVIGVAEHKIRVNSRYTYIEIGLKDVIISLYDGCYTSGQDDVVIRKMIVVPLGSIQSLEAVKNGKLRISTDGAMIRVYAGNTDRLGYYFKDGTLVFKEFFYQESGFEAVERVIVPRRFENVDEIIDSVVSAKERFHALPTAQPYVFEEMPHVKTRKIRELVKKMRNYD